MIYYNLVDEKTIILVSEIINKYYQKDSLSYKYYVGHVNAVTQKAFEIAIQKPDIAIDFKLLYMMSMLHDIGICKTHAPDIGCNGDLPYLSHANEGKKILENEGFASIASICEKHVGVGISRQEIIEKNLPLEAKDMFPETIEEKIVCVADKFFSKKQGKLQEEKPLEKVRKKMLNLGTDKLERFDALARELL